MLKNSTSAPLLPSGLLEAGCRYVVNISFKRTLGIEFKKVENIAEPVKTLKEAREYKSLVDDTVAKACIVDRVTGKVVEWWLH